MKTLHRFMRHAGTGLLAMSLTVAVGHYTGAQAHDGMEDVTGTVQTVTDKAVSVKTTKGKTVEVKLDSTTEYTRGKVAAKQADLKAGDRVVVHAMEMKGSLTAHLVQLPAAKAGKAATK